MLARGHWARNLLSGVIVGVVALPLAMAFAIASGAKPEQGLYTAIVAGIVVTLFGGSRLQIAGPTGAFIVILAAVTAEHGIAGLQIASMMAGVILMLLGFARLGAMVRFIPDPVIVGFTAGIAVVIAAGQLGPFLGLPAINGEHFHEKLVALGAAMPELHAATALIGSGSLLILLGVPRIPFLSKVPAPLVALAIATLVQSALQLPGVATIGSAFGGIPSGLPSFQVPEITLTRALTLIGPAFTIAMLGAIESLLSAVVADGLTGTRHDSNQELIGQGLANIAAPLFGGFAATGAIARTATNVRSGGTSPLAGIVHVAFLIGVLLLLAPLAASIPLAALAAILLLVSWNMSDMPRVVKILRRAPRADIVVLLVTLVLTVFADLVVAVNIGVILATLQFMRRMASTVEALPQTTETLAQELLVFGIERLPPDVLVYRIDGPFFFGAVEQLEHTLLRTHSDPRVLILRLERVPFIDATGLQTLEDVIRTLRTRNVRVLLVGANATVQVKLQRAGVVAQLSDQALHSDLGEALAALGTATVARADTGTK